MTMLLSYHDIILIVIVLILSVIRYILLLITFNKLSNRTLKEAHKVEFIWTVAPEFILRQELSGGRQSLNISCKLDVARTCHVMAALPNVDVACEVAYGNNGPISGRKKSARRSQQLQGRRIWSLAVMVRKRRSETHLFYFFDLQPRLQIMRVQSRKMAPNCGANLQIFAPQNVGMQIGSLWSAL